MEYPSRAEVAEAMGTPRQLAEKFLRAMSGATPDPWLQEIVELIEKICKGTWRPQEAISRLLKDIESGKYNSLGDDVYTLLSDIVIKTLQGICGKTPPGSLRICASILYTEDNPAWGLVYEVDSRCRKYNVRHDLRDLVIAINLCQRIIDHNHEIKKSADAQFIVFRRFQNWLAVCPCEGLHCREPDCPIRHKIDPLNMPRRYYSSTPPELHDRHDRHDRHDIYDRRDRYESRDRSERRSRSPPVYRRR